MPVLELNSVEDTILWKRLDAGFSGEEARIARQIAAHLVIVCREANDRMRGFPSLHHEYTLHDEVHLLRVTELMSRIMPQHVADALNPIEIMLLILAAHFHDLGMVLEREEIEKLPESPEFKLFQDNWEIAHPNLREIRQHLRDRTLSQEEQARYREAEHELHAGLLTDYVRQNHGPRSANLVRGKYGTDARWNVVGTNVADMVARLCVSHVRPGADLTAVNGFRCDEAIGPYRVNMPYLGVILRLADILDFDRDRTPDALYRTIHFKSRVSLAEWAKHRSVDGWVIEPSLVQFTMRCEHPEYQRAAYHFMDWIDRELTDAQALCHAFPASVSHYVLELPPSVDRSRIEPKDDGYIYRDLEFSLSRDEVVKLLMTEPLYGAPWLCVRELLQNALDALRHRQALFLKEKLTWGDGKVEMEHFVDEHGYEVVRCTDNGVGMDQAVIDRFLTRAGRSYYRSPEFEQERAGFRAVGVDFDPCAQFGIGFMSCFMLGDQIVVRTRRDYGPGREYGKPLIIEINGLGGIVVLRPGRDDQSVGTTVEITGRKKPGLLDEWEDRVRLTAVLEGYALACEFPISGRCSVAGLVDSVEIPPEPSVPNTGLEKLGFKSICSLTQQFCDIDSRLRGSIRVSFLVDEAGRPVLVNSEAEWRGASDHENRGEFGRLVQNGAEVKELAAHRENQTCQDGILVAGEPGRGPGRGRALRLGAHGNPIDAGRFCHFMVDVRGPIKPPLTPSRFPLHERAGGPPGLTPQWDFIQMLVNKAEGRLWEQMLRRFAGSLDAKTFWILATIHGHYNTRVHWIPARTVWSSISLPILSDEIDNSWQEIRQLGMLEPVIVPAAKPNDRPTFFLRRVSGGRIGAYGHLAEWAAGRPGSYLDCDLTHLAASMSTVVLAGNQVRLELRAPEKPELPPWGYTFRSPFSSPLMALPHSGEIRDLVSVHMPARSVNRHHLLVHEALEARYLKQPSDFHVFAAAAVRCLSDPETVELLSNARHVPRWCKHVGHRFLSVDWNRLAEELQPPYSIRSLEGETLEVTARVFERWADSEIREEG